MLEGMRMVLQFMFYSKFYLLNILEESTSILHLYVFFQLADFFLFLSVWAPNYRGDLWKGLVQKSMERQRPSVIQ